MEKIGRKYMREGHRAIQQAEWYSQDLINMEIEEKYDMVISSYVLNEMTGSAGKTVISKLWNCADKLLVIIEPGTPKGFDVIKYAREQLLNLGAHIVAPCPHEQECRIKSDDWCHFTCRVQRSKLHKLIKMPMFLMKMKNIHILFLRKKSRQRRSENIKTSTDCER